MINHQSILTFQSFVVFCVEIYVMVRPQLQRFKGQYQFLKLKLKLINFYFNVQCNYYWFISSIGTAAHKIFRFGAYKINLVNSLVLFCLLKVQFSLGFISEGFVHVQTVIKSQSHLVKRNKLHHMTESTSASLNSSVQTLRHEMTCI